MNKRTLIYGLLIVGVIVVFALVFGLSPTTESPEKKEQTAPVASTPTASVPQTNQTPPSKEETGKALQSAFDALVKNGAVRSLPEAKKYLQDEVASGDKGRILRAFHDIIYSRSWKMSEAIPALKSFLNDPDPYVRLNAAHDLFIVGDQSGYDALLALVQAKDPIPGLDGGWDVRVEAARTLAQFRQTDATQAIYDLYQQTKNGGLIQPLADLNATEATSIVQSKGFFVDASAMKYYGQVGATQFIPQITSTFYNTQKPDVKAAAAWALATMNGDQNAVAYLVQTAQAALNDPSQTGSMNERNIISYLGSIQTPAAKQTLEAALTSSDPAVVQTAITNLIYNQGGSDKAVQVIANQLSNSTHATLPWDFTMNMATQLLNNPQIQSAGQVFSQTDATGEWQLYTVERANWSPYNWMGGVYIKPKK
jgi:HEAT repeat protein